MEHRYPRNFLELQIPENLPDCGYIYHLLDERGKILYIGQSKKLLARIGQHVSEKVIPFKTCQYFICDLALISDVATEEILTHWPPYNRQIPPNSNYFSLECYKKINPILKGKSIEVRKILKTLQIEDRHGYIHIKDITKICEELKRSFT